MEASGKRTRLVADVPVVHRRGQGTGTRDATLGQVTHARFQAAVGRTISPIAPAVRRRTLDVIAARDRLAGATTLVVAWSDATSDGGTFRSVRAGARSCARQRHETGDVADRRAGVGAGSRVLGLGPLDWRSSS
jgi:hypothetical protein